MKMPRPFLVALLAGPLGLPGFLGGCLGPTAGPPPGDPTILLRSQAGDELGVSTDYGVLFLNRSGQQGWIDLTAWFSD